MEGVARVGVLCLGHGERGAGKIFRLPRTAHERDAALLTGQGDERFARLRGKDRHVGARRRQ